MEEYDNRTTCETGIINGLFKMRPIIHKIEDGIELNEFEKALLVKEYNSVYSNWFHLNDEEEKEE